MGLRELSVEGVGPFLAQKKYREDTPKMAFKIKIDENQEQEKKWEKHENEKID